MSSCMFITDFFENCAHVLTTTVCSDSDVFARRARDGECQPNCIHINGLPNYKSRQTCPFCLALPGKPNLPPTIIRSDDRVVLPISKIETRRWRFKRHAADIQQARQRAYSARRRAIEERRLKWEGHLSAARVVEEANDLELSQRTFYKGYDDKRLFGAVRITSATDDKEDCAICLMPHNNSTKKLPCEHIFHRKCVEIWLYKQEQRSCPMCQQAYKIENMPSFDLLEDDVPIGTRFGSEHGMEFGERGT